MARCAEKASSSAETLLLMEKKKKVMEGIVDPRVTGEVLQS